VDVSNELNIGDLIKGTIGSSSVTIVGDLYADSFTGDLTGNADTVTDGVYTTGSYSDPSWITSLDTSKIDLSTVTTALSTKVDLTETSSVTLQSNLGVGGTLDVTGNINTAEKYQIGGAPVLNISGSGNSMIGQSAGHDITTGDYNTFVGRVAGYKIPRGIITLSWAIMRAITTPRGIITLSLVTGLVLQTGRVIIIFL